jgi:pimeloyl-ACP methyl ester carboxylesterase
MLNTIIHGEKTDKPTLLIAHGLFGSARNWGVIAKRLSADRQVIAVDMRNHGSSPWFQTHSYADLADDLAAMIDGPVDLLGHSMGGKAAMVTALQNPHKINKLIVADIAPVAYQHSQMGPLAAMRGVDLDVVDSRADAKAVDRGGMTALTLAADAGHSEVVEVLINGNVEDVEASIRSHLFIPGPVCAVHDNVVEKLLNAIHDTQHKDKYGTPLRYRFMSAIKRAGGPNSVNGCLTCAKWCVA